MFLDDADYVKYLALLREEASIHRMRVVGYCLMPNHVHIVGIPAREDSLANTLGRTHQRYSAHMKKRYGRHGHFWQNRFYSCPMDENHTIRALCYVELNPVRANMIHRPWDFPWSSAKAHCSLDSTSSLMDLARWRRRFTAHEWREFLLETSGNMAFASKIRRCTHKGWPLGDTAFHQRVAEYLGRK